MEEKILANKGGNNQYSDVFAGQEVGRQNGDQPKPQRTVDRIAAEHKTNSGGQVQ